MKGLYRTPPNRKKKNVGFFIWQVPVDHAAEFTRPQL